MEPVKVWSIPVRDYVEMDAEARASLDNLMKETKCTYCNASFEIERENESESVIPENFLLHQKTVRRMSTAIMIISIIVFIAIFISFILMFF